MIRRLTLRGIAAHKLRLGLTALAVILSVGFISGTMVFAETMNKSIDGVFAEIGQGTDTVVRTKRALATELGTDLPDKPVPASLLKTLEAVPQVDKAHGTVDGFAAVLDKHGKVVGEPPQSGVGWYEDKDLSPIHLQKGAGPRTPDEIAIDSGTAKKSGYKVGDRVKVILGQGSREFTVSGVFKYGESGDLSNVLMTAFEPATAQKLLMEQPGTYRQISLHAKAGVSQTELRDAVARALPPGYEAITGKKAVEERSESVKDILGILRTFVLVFAGVAVFVGSFIIFNTFSMLVAQRTRELALLRAVGASRRQVTAMVLGEAAAIGVIGSTLGLLSGFGLGIGLRALFSALNLGIPVSHLALPSSAVIWSYAVGVLVTLAGAFLPARRASAIPPVAAMRQDGGQAERSLKFRAIAGGVLTVGGAIAMSIGFTGSGSSALALSGIGAAVFFIGITTLSPLVSRPVTRGLGWPFARLAGATGRLSRENAQRSPRRTAATASALMIGLTLITGISVISSSIIDSTDKQIDDGLTADYRVTSPSSQTPLNDSVRAALAKTPGVSEAIATRTARFRLGGKVSKATAGEPAQLIKLYKLRMEAGSASLGRNGLLVNRATADSNHWTVGSSVQGQYQDGATATFHIAGIFHDVKTVLDTAPGLILGTADFRAHYSDTLIQQIDVITANGPSADVRQSLDSALAPWPNLDLKDRDAIKKQYTASIDLLLRMVLVLLALSIIIATLGIINTLALSVVERTREIGLLRAVGMQRRQVRRMVRYEAVVISTFGSLLGMVVGVVLASAIQNAASDEGMKVLTIPFGQLLLYLVLGALIGVVAAAFPARRASRMDVLRAIGSE